MKTTIPAGGVVGRLPFEGRWLTETSPTKRIPSHGTHRFATTYAYDFIAVDEAGRSLPRGRPLSLLVSPPLEAFFAFGQPLYSPVEGTVVAVHDGEPDHAAYRSFPSQISYVLSQQERIRRGVVGMAGNHVFIRATQGGYVGLVHLQQGSVRVSPGDRLSAGDPLGNCGNSGNSTQPHLHIQALDGLDLETASGLPLRFVEFQQFGRSNRATPTRRQQACPDADSIISLT